MTTYRSAAQLISTIQENQKILDDRVKALSTVSPSLEHGISDVLEADEKATLARNAIVDASADLSALNKGSMGVMSLPAHNLWSSLHVVAKFDLATAIPVEGDVGLTYQQIADARHLDVSVVKRVIKNVITLYIFMESPDGTVRHNAASRYLACTPDACQWINMVMEELWPAATKVAQALETFPGSQEPNETPYCLAHNTNVGFFNFLGQNPARFRRFADAMTWFSSGPGLEASHLVNGYPWAEIVSGKDHGKVVDVGGSLGVTSMAVAKGFPSLSFVVQDLPQVAEVGRQQPLPAELKDRLIFKAHDFFTSQPEEDADVFLLRQICHDWSDKYAAKILSALIPAMEKGRGKIVIMEQIIPEAGQISLNLEQAIRSFDIGMLQILNGKERDISDWKELFAKVDSRLELSRTFQPPGSRMGILEVVLQS